MPSKSKKHKKYWFTLAEMLMVCSVFAIMIAGLIVWINRAYVFMNNTKLQTIATNLAREWMEMMYNMRDSCFRRNSWNADKCLKRVNSQIWAGGGNYTLFRLDEYVRISWDWDLKGYQIWRSDLGWCYENEKEFWGDRCKHIRNRAVLSFTGEYKYLSWMEMVTWDLATLLWNEVEFYRLRKTYMTHNKNSNNAIDMCNSTCQENWTPAEMRFCVKVFYRNNGDPHSTELCSIMTNFME